MANITINNILDSSYGAALIDRAVNTQAIESFTEWMDNAIDGTLLNQVYQFREIKLTFVIKGENEEDAFKKISYLTQNLKDCNIVFSDMESLTFHCFLNNSITPERLQNGVFKAIYTLKFDWAKAQPISGSFDIEQVNAQKITLRYINNWSSTIKSYQACYDDNEKYETIAEETTYIDRNKIEQAAQEAADWNSFFLSLGIDINKHKPAEGNTLNGFVYIETEYSQSAATAIFDKQNAFSIYYNRYQKDGFADLPLDTTYPSIVWTTGETNNYYFDLGVGKGWDIRDITLYVWGRWFYTITSTGNGSMFGENKGVFSLSMNSPNAVVQADTTSTERLFEVYESSSSGSQINIQTLESISATPIRQYGFKSSQDDTAAMPGFVDVIFNGLTLDRIPIDSVILQNNLCLLNGSKGTGKYCEAARVQVYYKGELVKDLIPIAANVKNGFVNNYDNGLYDIVTMEFIPWSNVTGTAGQKPNEIMPLPNGVPGPTPPVPPTPKYNVEVISGTGSGKYEEGALVMIDANEPEQGFKFDKWEVLEGSPNILNPEFDSTSFLMPAENVAVEAKYSEIQPVTEPKILYYYSTDDIEAEKTMGADAGIWNESEDNGDGPYMYDGFCAVYSIPNVSGTWEIYNSRYYSEDAKGTDKFGRAYVNYFNNDSTSAQQYVKFTPSDGSDAVTQYFYLKSF